MSNYTPYGPVKHKPVGQYVGGFPPTQPAFVPSWKMGSPGNGVLSIDPKYGGGRASVTGGQMMGGFPTSSLPPPAEQTQPTVPEYTAPATTDSQQEASPQTSAYGDSASNSTQRWQQQALRQLSPARQFNVTTGLIDGRASMAQVNSGLSYSDRGANGFTPQAQWDDQFKGRSTASGVGHINIPKAKWAPY